MNKQLFDKYLKIFIKIIPFVFLCLIINDIFLKTYQYSFGADEFIVLSIPQYAITNSQNYLEYLYAISYGLFFEDHLNITINIISPLILALSKNNSLQIPNGALYITSLFLFHFSYIVIFLLV